MAVVLAALVLVPWLASQEDPGARAGWSSTEQASAERALSTLSPEEEYASVVGLVNQADRTVVPLSKLVSKTLDDAIAKRTKKVLRDKDSASALLTEARARLEAVTPQLDPQAEGAGAPYLADAIAAREDVLRYGSIVLEASVGAYELTDEVVDTWRCFIDGQSALSAASESVASGTTKEVRRALRSDCEALALFQKANGHIDRVAEKTPNVDLSAERDYVSLQEQAAAEAAKSDEALLDEDAKRASKHNDAYREASAKAAKAAKKLPATTDDLVKSIYYSLGADGVSVQDAQNKYEAAAKRASRDDRKLAAVSDR